MAIRIKVGSAITMWPAYSRRRSPFRIRRNSGAGLESDAGKKAADRNNASQNGRDQGGDQKAANAATLA